MAEGKFVVTWERTDVPEGLQTSANESGAPRRFTTVRDGLAAWEESMRARAFIVTPTGRIGFQAFGYDVEDRGGARWPVRVVAWEIVREMTGTEAG